jgi:TatD DNase family protein
VIEETGEMKDMVSFVDTHCHLDGEEFDQDRAEVMQRAREAGCKAIFLPAIDLPSSQRILALSQQYPDFLYPMIGLHPEEVRADWREQLAEIRRCVGTEVRRYEGTEVRGCENRLVAIGEVGLDFYWSREFEKEQLEAFEEQVRWSVETRLPLMIHCRKAQNEMVHILKRYASELPGGVFHCFTGNEKEAAELLQFDRFVLGVGGVLTFKKSHLPEVLQTVPLSRIVLETDSPYMAPVPMRGKRNESAYVLYVLKKLAESLGVTEEEVARQTNENVKRVFAVDI